MVSIPCPNKNDAGYKALIGVFGDTKEGHALAHLAFFRKNKTLEEGKQPVFPTDFEAKQMVVELLGDGGKEFSKSLQTLIENVPENRVGGVINGVVDALVYNHQYNKSNQRIAEQHWQTDPEEAKAIALNKIADPSRLDASFYRIHALNNITDMLDSGMLTKDDYAEMVKLDARESTETAQTLQSRVTLNKTGHLLESVSKIIDKATETDNVKVDGIVDGIKETISDVHSGAIDGAIDDAVTKTPALSGDVLDKPASQQGSGDGKPPEGETTETGGKEEFSPEEQLAYRIQKLVEDKKKENDPVRDMVNQLFKVAKDSPIEGKKIIAKTPLEFIAGAIKNRDQYGDIFDKAKEIVSEKFKDNPDALAKLDDFFKRITGATPFTEGQLGSAIKQGMKEQGITIRQLIRDRYTDYTKKAGDLSKMLVEQAGLSREDADLFLFHLENKLEKDTAMAKEKALAQLLADKKVKPNVRKSLLQNIVEISNMGGFDNPKYEAAIKEKLGIPDLTGGLTAKIADEASRIEKIEDPNRRESEMAALLKREVLNKLPKTLGAKVDGWIRIAMLSLPKTYVKIFTSHAAFSAIKFAEELNTGAIDSMVGKGTGERKVFAPDKASMSAFRAGAKQGWSKIMEDIWAGADPNLKRGIRTFMQGIEAGVTTSKFGGKQRGQTYDSSILNFISNSISYAHTMVSRPMQEGWKAYQEEQMGKLLGRHDFTKEEQKKIQSFADENALMKEDAITEGLGKIINEVGLPARAISVFRVVPVNIVERFIDWCPGVGLARAGIEARKLIGMGDGIFNQEKFVRALGQQATGAELMTLGLWLYSMGAAKGSSEDEKGEHSYALKETEQTLGIQNNSFVFRDKQGNIIGSLNANFLEPMMGIVFMGVNAGEYYTRYLRDKKQYEEIKKGTAEEGLMPIESKKPSKWDIVGGTYKEGIKTLFDMPLLMSIKNLGGNGNIANGLVSTMANIPMLFVPTPVRAAARTSDEYVRYTKGDTVWETALNRIESNFPWLREKMPIKYDLAGQPVRTARNKEGLGMTLINNWIFPGTWRDFKTDEPGISKAYSLYMETGEVKQLPKEAWSHIMVGNTRVQLTGELKMRMQKEMGETYKQLADEKVNDPEFLKLDKQGQIINLQKIAEASLRVAKAKVLGIVTKEGNEEQ